MKCCMHDFLERFIQQKIILYLQLSFIQQKIILYLQLSKSSRAFFGGAYFSAVSGWKSIPISVPGPYECLEWYRLLVFFTTNNFCFAPNSHNAPAAPLACQMDLCLSWPHWFVRQTNPWVLFLHKSIWNTHGAVGSLWLFGAKLKLLVVKKQVAYTILGTHTVLGH